MNDPKTVLTAIVQTGPEREALPTSYLAELLDLSIDRPQSLYSCNLRQAEQKLLACPLISEAKVKRMPPNALYVDYTIRKPIAYLSDYRNVGFDRDGFLLTIAPFFSPKQLPEVYLGLPAFGEAEDAFGRKGGRWQTPLSNKHLHLALDLLETLSDLAWREKMRIKRIDVSNAYAKSLGQREIVIFTEEELIEREVTYLFPKVLRIATKNYAQQLSNFLGMRKTILDDYRQQIKGVSASSNLVRFAPRIIDLRIPQMALIENT